MFSPAKSTQSFKYNILLVAWCVVPFDAKKRGPEERAEMLDHLGIKQLAYDWRAEHVPTFDEEIKTLNQHHGHQHLNRFPALLKKMLPYLHALNLNGMMRNGATPGGNIILPLGQGDYDLELLKMIRDSGYCGPIGILNHTGEDAEGRLHDNLDGLDWLVAQLDGKPAGAKPQPRTWHAP